MPTVSFKRLNARATFPEYHSLGAIGLDLATMADVDLAPGERSIVKTGLSVAIPDGFYGRVAPKSGLAAKHGIDVLAGVIDSDYRGEVGVVLINLGQNPVRLQAGDRIAQLIFEQAKRLSVVDADYLEETLRGRGGFGSTGT